MKMVLSDIKRGFKIKTIMKRHGISATLVIACMSSLDTYGLRQESISLQMALHGYMNQSHHSENKNKRSWSKYLQGMTLCFQQRDVGENPSLRSREGPPLYTEDVVVNL